VPRASGKAEAETVVLEGAGLKPDPAEVFRYLGYPKDAPVEPRVAQRVEQALEKLLPEIRPRAMYRIYPVLRSSAHRLELPGAVFTGRIGEFLGEAQRAAVFLATAGTEIVAAAEAAMEARDFLGGLVCHAIGAALAEAMVERTIEHLRGQLGAGEALTLPYSPGYCGIPLEQQRTLFGLLDASLVGVQLLPTMIMRPLKTISGLIGIGPEDRVRAYGNPCDRCPLVDCQMRR
jgi:hypothetical protein